MPTEGVPREPNVLRERDGSPRVNGIAIDSPAGPDTVRQWVRGVALRSCSSASFCYQRLWAPAHSAATSAPLLGCPHVRRWRSSRHWRRAAARRTCTRDCSCPTYLEDLAPRQHERYVLNCRPAGALAPHATVRFAMVLRVAKNAPLGRHGLLWLLGPKTALPPTASAPLLITR